MSNIFQITPYSSCRFANQAAISDPNYHTNFFDNRIDGTNYKQKVQITEANFHIQLLSDFTPVLELFTCKDISVKVITLTTRTITGATYLVYDGTIDFSDVDEGVYYLKITYTDESDVDHDLRSSPLNVAEDWPGTLKFEYTNTYNDKGVVFINEDKSQLVFGFRIEANFSQYQPLSADIDYIDQVYDSEVLNNTPYDNEKLTIGIDPETGGAPDWAIQKMNLIVSLNKVLYDGQAYNKVEGSKFTPTRADIGTTIYPIDYPNGVLVWPTSWSIDIIPNENINLGQLIPGDTPTGDFIVIYKAWPESAIPNWASSFSIAGVFTVNSRLAGLALWNFGLDEFDILVGTGAGLSDITTINIRYNPDSGIVDLTSWNDIGHVFNGATTVFITVPDGVNIKTYFEYTQLDAKPVAPPTPGGGLGKGAQLVYTELVEGDFALDWNVGTGLGLRGWVGWGLCDGQDGRPNKAGKYSVGWDKTLPLTRGTDTGNSGSELTLTRAVLPDEGIAMFDNSVNTTRGDLPTTSSNVARAGNPAAANYLNYEMLKGTPGAEPTLGLTAKLGDGDPLSIAPDSLIEVWVVKIVD